MAIGGTKVVQVTNIAPQATKDQMQTLFGYLGKIDDIRLYPTIRDVSCPVTSRICYIKFVDTLTVGVAQHMTNTVFIDRALIVIPVQNGEIPDEYFALEMTRNGTIVPGLCPSEPNLPPHVINTVTNLGSGQVIITYDPKLESNGLPQYPPLPANYDSHKIEEIRRTILIKDVDPTNTNEDYIDFFSPVAEIKYLRSCTKPSDDFHMLVEFSDQPSIIEVLKMNGKEFKGKPIQLVHATEAIVKPQAKSNEAAQKEIEEAMSRVKEAQNLISATIDPVIGMLSKDKRSSRRSRSRSRGRRRRSRSRSRSRRRSRSRHRSRRSRSKSRDRKRRSKSRSHRRSRSRSRRSSSHSRNSKTRKSRSKSRSKTSRRHKSKERPKSPKEKEIKSKDVDRPRERDRKPKDVERERESKEKRAERECIVEIEEKRTSKKRSPVSPSRTKIRSKSRERKKSKSRERRSRSRGRKRTPSPRPRRRRSKSRSRDREHRREKQRDKREKRERSPSLPRTSRNYDEEERGYDSERSRRKDYGDSYETDNQMDKDSSEKSDNMDISNSP